MVWCLAAAIAWAAALLWPDLDWRAAGLLLGVAVVGGVGSDLTPKGDTAAADFGSNAAAVLVGAGTILLARLLLTV